MTLFLFLRGVIPCKECSVTDERLQFGTAQIQTASRKAVVLVQCLGKRYRRTTKFEMLSIPMFNFKALQKYYRNGTLVYFRLNHFEESYAGCPYK